MKRWQYFTAPLVLGVALYFGAKALFGIPWLNAVSVPVTFSDGNVLTAAQLNSNNTTIYNAFNAHDHDGGNGEASTLSDDVFAGITEPNVVVGDGAGTGTGSSAPGISVDSNTGDARLSLQMNDATADTWHILADNSDSDTLKFFYEDTELFRFSNDDDDSTSYLRINEPSTDDAGLMLQVNGSGSNAWLIFNDNDGGDALKFDYAANGTIEGALSTTGYFEALKGIAGGGLSSTTHGIAWKVYTGTTDADSNTIVDSDPPGTGSPLFFGCMVVSGGGPAYGVQVPTNSQGYSTYWDSVNDDLELESVGGNFQSQAYKCIAFYIP